MLCKVGGHGKQPGSPEALPCQHTAGTGPGPQLQDFLATPSLTPAPGRRPQVIVYVEDVNDEAPVFTQQQYSRLALRETAGIGTSVIVVKATDRDTGEASRGLSFPEPPSPARTFPVPVLPY